MSKRGLVRGLKIVAGGFAVVIAAGAAFIATRPDDFRIERSAEVAAPPEAVFPLINDFHEWNRWSPFEKMDPAMKRTFDGPSSGVGAKYAWTGNDQAGEGHMTIEESKPAQLVSIKLEFTKPMAATNQAIFRLEPSGSGTRVTWSMEGKNSFVGKAFSTLMDMDKMVGGEFEKGLASLGAAAKEGKQANGRAAGGAAAP